MRLAGFSFEAGGQTFRPVISHSMSGTLITIFEGLFFIIIIFFHILNRKVKADKDYSLSYLMSFL